jgi:hypothetical protein
VVGGKTPVPTPFVLGQDPKEEKGIRNKRDIPRLPIHHHLTAIACEDIVGENR